MKQLPECDKPIKFRTIHFNDLFVGKRKDAKLSNGKEFIYFITDETSDNRHWTSFTKNEIVEWQYL